MFFQTLYSDCTVKEWVRQINLTFWDILVKMDWLGSDATWSWQSVKVFGQRALYVSLDTVGGPVRICVFYVLFSTIHIHFSL